MKLDWKLKTGITVILLIAFAVFVFSSPTLTGHVTATSVEKIKAGDISLIQNAPLYLALERSYFKDSGIEIEIVKFDAPKQIVDSVILDQIDFIGPAGATGISAIAESLQPGGLKYYSFSCNTGDTGFYLLVPLDSNITSMKNLTRKRIGQLPGPQWRTLINRMLTINGIDPKKV